MGVGIFRIEREIYDIYARKKNISWDIRISICRTLGSNKENARAPLPLPGKFVRGAPKRSLYFNR